MTDAVDTSAEDVECLETSIATSTPSTTSQTSWTPTRDARHGGGRPRGGYGAGVPGVTSVLSVLGKGDALLGWAAKLASEGRSWREERDKSAELGTDIHAAILDGLVVGDERALEVASGRWGEVVGRAVYEYERWEKRYQPTIEIVEVPLVSQLHSFAGTLDMVARIDGALTLVDVKTSPRAYGSYAIQLAAYDLLWREHHGEGFARFMILRLPKDGRGRFKLYDWRDLGPARECFLLARQLYALTPHVERLTK